MRSPNSLPAFLKYASASFAFGLLVIFCQQPATAYQEKKTESSSGQSEADQQPPKKLVEKTTPQEQKKNQDKPEQKKPAPLDLTPKQPLLWKVTHKNNPKLLGYLFATTHSRNPSVLKFHPAVSKAMEESDYMFMEIVPRDSGRQAATLLLPKHQKIEHRISPELIKKLDEAIPKIKPDLSREKLPRFRIWAWGLVLPALFRQEQNPGAKSQDDFLIEFAAKNKKGTDSLEDPGMQLVPLNYLSQKEQAAFLESTLSKFDDHKREQEYLQLYMEGQPEKLDAFFEKDFQPNQQLNKIAQFKLKNYLVLVRNKKIGKKIAQNLVQAPDKIQFFSAATAHMVGQHSIPKLLSKAGYTVNLIRDGQPNILIKQTDADQPAKQ